MSAAEVHYCYTAWIRKLGRAVFLGHRDYARVVQRALHRSGLPLRMTQGFHPHPKMQLPEPLPLGVGSEGEAFVLFLTEQRAPEEVHARVGEQLPEGMELWRTVEGKHPEERDAALWLRLEGVEEEATAALLDAGSLGLARCEFRGDPEGLMVHLVPEPGKRVSVGRLIRTMAAEEAAPRSVVRVHPSEPCKAERGS